MSHNYLILGLLSSIARDLLDRYRSVGRAVANRLQKAFHGSACDLVGPMQLRSCKWGKSAANRKRTQVLDYLRRVLTLVSYQVYYLINGSLLHVAGWGSEWLDDPARLPWD